MRTARLRLDFATRRKAASLPGRILLACGLALVVLEALHLGPALIARHRDQATLAELESRSSVAAVRPDRPVRPDPAYLGKVRATERLARSLTTPWAGLLDAIESTPQQSVALLTVEPSRTKQSLRLTAEARDSTAMIEYLEALQKDRRLLSVVLTSHQLQAQTAGTPLRFQLQAQWGLEP